jgi:N6-L-threonylcarbamoyladenine synthase
MNPEGAVDIDRLPKEDLAASFQEAVIDVLVTKTQYAAREYGVQGIIVSGGVSANSRLREMIQVGYQGKLFIPPIEYCTDNAAMVAAAGFYRFVNQQRDPLDIDALPTWPLTEI